MSIIFVIPIPPTISEIAAMQIKKNFIAVERGAFLINE